MYRAVAIRLLTQIAAISSALILAFLIGMPWPALALLAIVGVSPLGCSETAPSRFAIALVASAAVPGILVLSRWHGFAWDYYHATIAWLMAVPLLLAGQFASIGALKIRWRILGMGWVFTGIVLWIAAAYLHNHRALFSVGLLIAFAWLLLCKSWFRLPDRGILLVNTLILLLVGLPLADLFTQFHFRAAPSPDPQKRYYDYAVAKKNPRASAAWQTAYNLELGKLWKSICMRPQSNDRPWDLVPNSTGHLFQSQIRINSRGFRGAEIQEPKGNAYRIVALGESTTFGLTLNANDRPWPEQLEQMIRERLKPDRRVEIINTAVPGYDLPMNVNRLSRDFLSLKPDMVLSYHGANGFHLIEKNFPLSFGPPGPPFVQRPVNLLARCEYNWKLATFKRERTEKLSATPPAFTNLMASACAASYRELIDIARTNGIRLVLANYSMPVNGTSDMDVVEFYRPMWPAAYWLIKANDAHSTIVAEVARENPEVIFVDTRSVLDGKPDNFIDIMHFSPEGERIMAETFFAAIRKQLENDLATKPANAQ